MNLRYVAGCAAALVLANLMVSPAALADQPAAPAPALTAGTVGTYAGATATTQIVVPAGLVPTALKATINVDDPAGTVAVRAGDITLFSAHGESAYQLSLILPPAIVSQDTIQLALAYSVPPTSDQWCHTISAAQARLSGISVSYAGTEIAPTSLAYFFPAYTPQVNVSVPAGSSDDVLAAGLSAVGALSYRFGQPTTVTLNGAAPMVAGSRTIAIASGPNPVTARISDLGGKPTLTLTGSGPALASAASYLGERDPIRLVDSIEASGPTVTKSVPDLAATLHQTLEPAVGSDQLVLTGYGTSQTYVGLKQDRFGGPIDQLRLRLPFTHTAVPPGATAQLDILFNNHLLWSRDLGRADDGNVTADVVVNAANLLRDNGLVVRLAATPVYGHCVRGSIELPLEVHLATSDAQLDAERGFGTLTGFGVFPQVLAGSLPVALRGSGAERDTQARQAAAVIVALQQAASAQLGVSLVEADRFVSGSSSGLLVGATQQDAASLRAPLRLEPMRILQDRGAEYQASNGQPFATLEAIRPTGRDVLMLGSWSDGQPAGTSRLMNRLTTYVGQVGWSGLSNDVLATTPHQKPFTIASLAFAPSHTQLREHGRFAYWFVVGVAVLLLLLGVNYVLTRRRRRVIRAIVDAQEKADAVEAE